MDDADRAQAAEERWLEQAIQPGLGIKAPKPSSSHCSDCGELLEPHRIFYGVCVDCALLVEVQRRWR